MDDTRTAFVKRLTKLIAGSIDELEKAEQDPTPEAIARLVASNLWGQTRPGPHRDIRAWIRHIRGALGFSQAQLADAIGANQVTIARWETGKSYPSPVYIRMLVSIARQLGIEQPEAAKLL